MPTQQEIADRALTIARAGTDQLVAFMGATPVNEDSEHDAHHLINQARPSSPGSSRERATWEVFAATHLLLAGRCVTRSPTEDTDEDVVRWMRVQRLEHDGWRAIARGDLSTAERAGSDLITETGEGSGESDGMAYHRGRIMLGHVRVLQGDLEAAGAELALAGRADPSPPLMSFGPDLSLALELLKLDQVEVVVEYLRDVSRYWQPRRPWAEHEDAKPTGS